MRRPSSHSRSSSRRGRRVDLPAPGGATSTQNDRSVSAERTSSTTSSMGRSVRGTGGIRTGSGHGRGAVERHRIARCGDRRHRPRRGVGDRLGDGAPLHGVPTLGSSRHGPVGANEDEGGQRREAEAAHESSIGIGEHQELLGQWAEERLCFVIGCGDDEVDAHGGSGEAAQDASRGVEDPRALVGVRVEHDRCEVERGQPLGQRAGLGADRIEGGGGGRGRNHGVNGSAPKPLV